MRCGDKGRRRHSVPPDAAAGRWFYLPGSSLGGTPEADSIDCRWSRAEGLSVGYWPLAINIMTHSGVRPWTGSRLSLGVTVDG